MRTVASTVGQIFAACPELFGFSIAGAVHGEVWVADVVTDPHQAAPEGLPEEIAEVLHDLIDEEPATADLLRGRTFARVLH